MQAILALEKFPTTSTQQALMDLINQNECFYKVRLEACFCLAKVRNAVFGLNVVGWVYTVYPV